MQKGTGTRFFTGDFTGMCFAYCVGNKMKKIFLVFCAFLVVAAPAYGAEGGIRLLFFYRHSCRWCRMMDDVINDPSIKPILHENVRVEKIDIYGVKKLDGWGLTGAQLKERYKVFGIPTLIFMDRGGKELLRVPGVLTKEDFKDLVCNHVGISSADCVK